MNRYLPRPSSPEITGFGMEAEVSALGPMVDGLMEDVFSQIPEPGDARDGFEQDGRRYEFARNNISVETPREGQMAANSHTVSRVLMGAGLFAVGETVGLARDQMGTEYAGAFAQLADSSLPNGTTSALHNRLIELQRTGAWPHRVNTIDPRDARAALDELLASGDYPEAAGVAEAHRNRVFGKS